MIPPANLIFKKLQAGSLTPGSDNLTADVSKTVRTFFETKGFKVIRENKNMWNGVEILPAGRRKPGSETLATTLPAPFPPGKQGFIHQPL